MDWIEASAIGWRPYALLTALCLLLYLPGLATIPPLDRDEARFAQATRQMLETGDFLRIRFQDEARNKKPAGIYWLQAAAVALFSAPERTAIWPYRLPSVLGATAAVLLTFAFGGGLLADASDPVAGRRRALVAAILLAGALGVVAEAHIAKTDAALLAAAAAGQGALGLAYVRARAARPVSGWIAATFWLAETAAIFLKGPVAPALAGATAATLSIADHDVRWLRGLRPLAGTAGMALALAPWLAAIEAATGGRFLAEALGQDLGSKLLGGQESHGAPPLYYLLLIVLTFWPGSVLLVQALVRLWRRRQAPAERFLLAWIVPAWGVLELVPTKLPHYALPLFPALAFAAGLALLDPPALRAGSWARRVAVVGLAAWGAASGLLAIAMVVLPLGFGDQGATAGLVAALLLVGLAAVLLSRPQAAVSLPLIAALSAVFTVTTASLLLPQLDRLWLSRSAAGLVAQYPRPAGTPLVAVGYSEPSLVFLLGTDLRLAAAPDAAGVLAGGGEALVSGMVEPTFRDALAARGLAGRALGSVSGIDYSNGRRLTLTLYDVGRV